MNTHLFRLAFMLLLLSSIQLSAQSIDIGENADKVKGMVESYVNSYYRSRGSHSVRQSWDVEYSNGKISDVMLCYDNQFLLDFRASANFCKHYIMVKDTLAYILTQYENISIEQIEKFYNETFGETKIEGYYFTDNYTYYSKLYLAENGLATVKWGLASSISKNLKPATKLSLKKRKEIARVKRIELEQKQLTEAKRMAEEREIRERQFDSTVYNLETYNNALYVELSKEIKQQIIKYFYYNPSGHLPSTRFISFDEIAARDTPYACFNNFYRSSFKSYDKTQTELLAGNDTLGEFINTKVYLSLPDRNKQGIRTRTEAKFDIAVDFTRGITKITVKRGIVTFKKYPPSADIQTKIKQRLEKLDNGKYTVKYEIGKVMDEDIYNVQYELKEKLYPNTAWGLKAIGIALVVFVCLDLISP